MLVFKSFSKSYGTVRVLDLRDFRFARGVHWIRGVNGTGKSTLLRSAAGILHFQGDISVGDISLKKNGVEYRRLVNYGEAEPLFPEFLTGMEMIQVFLKSKGGSQPQKDQMIEEMKMNEYINSSIGTYSTGMVKKLSLVLAFIGKPEVILLDEPFITLDQKSLMVLHQWIRSAYDRGCTFLLASHQRPEALVLPDINEFLIEAGTLKVCVS